MELLVVAVLVAASVIGMGGLVFSYLVIKLITKEQVRLIEKQEIDNKDHVTSFDSQDTPDDTLPLENFTPDFNKPIKMITRVDDEGNTITEERPVRTDES